MNDGRVRFADGLAAAAAASGLMSPLQGRIFGLLYLESGPLSLDAIAEALAQSKSHVSVQIRGLQDAQLVRRARLPGSRKDHYEAVTDLWRVLCELLERRLRGNLRLLVATAEEAASGSRGVERRRLEALRGFASALDAGLAGFARGRAFSPAELRPGRSRNIRRKPQIGR